MNKKESFKDIETAEKEINDLIGELWEQGIDLRNQARVAKEEIQQAVLDAKKLLNIDDKYIKDLAILEERLPEDLKSQKWNEFLDSNTSLVSQKTKVEIEKLINDLKMSSTIKSIYLSLTLTILGLIFLCTILIFLIFK